MIETVKLINRSIIYIITFFLFLLVRKVKIDSLSNFQVYDTGLLTLVPMLHIDPRTHSSYSRGCTFEQYLLFSTLPPALG